VNIFFLDPDPCVAARAHNDKHVVKMPLETAQILSTVYHQFGVPAPYLPTHSKHPCTLWAARSRSNYAWLVRLGLALCDEYYARFGHRRQRQHASAHVIEQLREPPAPLPELGPTEPAQALPEPLRVAADPVAAYRAYYRANKAHIATWTLPGLRPDWFDQPMELASC
jgi:hypothetical protein